MNHIKTNEEMQTLANTPGIGDGISSAPSDVPTDTILPQGLVYPEDKICNCETKDSKGDCKCVKRKHVKTFETFMQENVGNLGITIKGDKYFITNFRSDDKENRILYIKSNSEKDVYYIITKNDIDKSKGNKNETQYIIKEFKGKTKYHTESKDTETTESDVSTKTKIATKKTNVMTKINNNIG